MKRADPPFDYELHFTSDGRVRLLDAKGKLRWSSDDDDNFCEDMETNVFDEDDEDDIVEYLLNEDILDEDDVIDIVAEDLEDYGGDTPLEGELIPAQDRFRKN